MKQHILSNKIAYLLPLTVLVLLAWGCSDKLVESDTNPITVKVETSVSVSELADVVSLFRLTVTAPDMEPVVAIQYYDGGPLVFELDIPAGRDRVFLLEGIHVTDTGERVIYRARSVADIEPNVAVDLTLHMEPVVPLIRFTPLRTVTASGQSFSVDLEIFNVPGLLETELLIQFDTDRLVLDSITKGSGLDESDVLEPIVGSDLPGLQIIIYDPNDPASGIVDETGYSHLARVYFTTNVQLEPAVTALEIVGLSYIASGGARFLPGEVFSHAATVEITQFAGALLRFLPSDNVVEPETVFGLTLEAHNLLTLYQVDMQLVYDDMVLRFDSISKGANLIGSDTIIVGEGSSAGTIEVRVSDPSGIEGSIVDPTGYSHMATVYFTALRPPLTAVTHVEIIPVELLAAESVGGSIPVSSVTAEGATVTVSSFTDVTMSFMTDQMDITSSEYFEVHVEFYNMPNLSAVEFSLLFEGEYVRFDSVTKGISLDASDAVWLSEGPGAAPIVNVQDTTGGLIVDPQGRSSAVTLYFGTNIVTEPISTGVTPSPITFTLVSGGSIPVDNVTLEDATLHISAFPDSILTFPDPGLEAAIRDQLLIYEPTPIYLSDVVFVEYLYAYGYAIQSIEGLEVFVHLRTLDLSVNDISDITPLSQLAGLDTLNLTSNNVSNLSPLANASNLTTLLLKENAITNISSLSGLYDLVELDLSNYSEGSYLNAITDLSPLASLTRLERLDISYNYTVSNISPLASLTSLIWLNLNQNDISDVSPLTDLSSITDLNLSYNNIVDIAPLATGTVLESGDYLYLWGNPIDPDACSTYMYDLLYVLYVNVYQSVCAYAR